MIPNIEFFYSSVYNEIIKNSKTGGLKETFPNDEFMRKYKKEVETEWREKEKIILNEISKISKLKWKKKEIVCYVVGSGRNFAFPLTITAWSVKTDFIDVLTHELIHHIQKQNQAIMNKWQEYVNTKYSKESIDTRNHLLLFAIHYKIYHSIFDKSRLQRNIERNKRQPGYKRSWEIIIEKGADSILKEYYNIIK